MTYKALVAWLLFTPQHQPHHPLSWTLCFSNALLPPCCFLPLHSSRPETPTPNHPSSCIYSKKHSCLSFVLLRHTWAYLCLSICPLFWNYLFMGLSPNTKPNSKTGIKYWVLVFVLSSSAPSAEHIAWYIVSTQKIIIELIATVGQWGRYYKWKSSDSACYTLVDGGAAISNQF